MGTEPWLPLPWDKCRATPGAVQGTLGSAKGLGSRPGGTDTDTDKEGSLPWFGLIQVFPWRGGSCVPLHGQCWAGTTLLLPVLPLAPCKAQGVTVCPHSPPSSSLCHSLQDSSWLGLPLLQAQHLPWPCLPLPIPGSGWRFWGSLPSVGEFGHPTGSSPVTATAERGENTPDRRLLPRLERPGLGWV